MRGFCVECEQKGEKELETPDKALEAHIGEVVIYPALCRLIGEDANLTVGSRSSCHKRRNFTL